MYFRRYLEVMITFDNAKEDVLVFTQDMKVTFNINALIKQLNSQAKIVIYNPSQDQIDRITANAGKATVSFDAGYEDNHGVIFNGSIMSVEQLREEADITLTIYCHTTLANLADYMVMCTFNKGISNIDLINQIARQIDFVQKIEIDKDIPVETIQYNAVKDGRACDYLDNLAKQYGFIWHIFGNVFKAEKLCKDTDNPIKITEKSGLIGIPQKTHAGVNLRVFLNPNLKVNRRIEVECKYSSIQAGDVFTNVHTNESANGTYYIWRLDFEGDTRGDQWCANITAQTKSFAAV